MNCPRDAATATGGPHTQFRVAVAVLFLLPALLVPAEATGGPWVDAGPSPRAATGQSFLLRGHVEGFSGPVAASWTAPPGCSVDDATLLQTSANCWMTGIRTFTLTATRGAEQGTDTVRAVVHATSTTATEATGTTLAGVPDEGTFGPPFVGGSVDGETRRVPVVVPAGGVELDVTLSWERLRFTTGTVSVNDFDMHLEQPDGSLYASSAGATASTPERLVVAFPQAGTWHVLVEPFLVVADTWHVRAIVHAVAEDTPMPAVTVPRAVATPGAPVTLHAQVTGGTPPYAYAWETDPQSRRFDDGSGPSLTFTYSAPTAARVRVTDALGLEAEASGMVRTRGTNPVTVVAVVDDAFSPYHFDFAGHQHPWNRDADAGNDFDFGDDPASYIPGYPGATPLPITVPATAETDVAALAAADAAVWGGMQSSDLAGQVNLYWIPGTKVVGAVNFGSSFRGANAAHGTRSAASAAGNWHGTCQECVVVLISGLSHDALAWAAAQPWIDVVTNSYGHSTTVAVRDNIWFAAPVNQTRASSEDGQVVVFSAGNGLANAFDVPAFTYWSSEKGPDWMVTVGAVAPGNHRTYTGAGKPVDISSIGSDYPSTGGALANGTGTHSGTSNAAPVAAGVLAQVLHEARRALGDDTPGHAGGVVASGTPVACGGALPGCALGDGVLTRRELQDLVFHNVLPSPSQGFGTTLPSTRHNYYYQGHGVLTGRMYGPENYHNEWSAMAAVAIGHASPPTRPDGEREWFQVDSQCRQRLWGTWSHGYHDGSEPAPTISDPLTVAFQAWCRQLPPHAFEPAQRHVGGIYRMAGLA